jgi:hypothetical protein
LSGEKTIQGLPEITACQRPIALGTTVIELSAIDQTALVIEDKDIRRTGRMVRLGDFLGGIEQVGEAIALRGGFALHVLEGIIGVGLGIVAIDPDESHAATSVVSDHSDQFRRYMLDVRTVVAHEDDHQRFGLTEISQADRLAIDVLQ